MRCRYIGAELQFSKSIGKSPRFSADFCTAGISRELARSGDRKLDERGSDWCEDHQDKETDYSSASVIFIAPAESSENSCPLSQR